MWTHSTIGRACRTCILLAASLICAAAAAGCSAFTGTEPLPTSSALVTYEDHEDLTRALGFDMVQISGGGYVPISYSTIDGRIGQIIYHKDDIELNIRMAKGGGDIAGVTPESYTPITVHGTEVQIGSFRDIEVAWFETGSTAYAVSATGMTPQLFEGFVTQFVDQLAPGD